MLGEDGGISDLFYILPRVDEPLDDWRDGEDIMGVVRICLFIEENCIWGDGEGWGGRSDDQNSVRNRFSTFKLFASKCPIYGGGWGSGPNQV